MRHSLLIYLHLDSSLISWATFDTTGQVINSAQQVSIQTAPKLPAWVLIPGTETLLTQADIPTKQWQRIVQAVPYALEEQLIDDVDELHFALGKRDPKTALIPVVVTKRIQMETYLQRLATVGITPVALIPDLLAVPKPSEGWGIIFWDTLILVRTGIHTGFTIETTGLQIALSIALREMTPPKQFTVFRGQAAIDLIPLSILSTFNLPVIEQADNQGALAWLVRGITQKKELNLLQGDYQPPNHLARLWQPWRQTATLLLLGGAIYFWQQWLEYQQLNQYYQQLNQAISKIYRDTFPQARKIVNPRIQMEQQLKTLRQPPGKVNPDQNFLILFNQLSQPFKQTQGVEITQLDYRNGVFTITITVTQWQVLEQLKQGLNNVGLTAKIQTATHRNERIESQLRINM